MPTYEYQCTVCGHRFEKFQSFSAEPLKECPVCGEPVKKVIAPAGIIFKGSGWYITDSKKSNSASPAASTEKSGSETSTDKTASGEKTETAKPAETATESKPTSSAKKEDAA
jgi:putative FmdB family regulatory protein